MASVLIQWPRLSRTAVLLCIVIASLPVITGDVPDGFVYTDLHRVARRGDELVLKCEFFGPPFAVFWKKGDDPLGSPTLITWSDIHPPSGPCVQNKSCEIGDNFSLIIHQTGISDQGRYFCLVANHDGILIDNFTDVTVFAPPVEPFPHINECPVMIRNGTEGVCIIATSNHVSITCSVSGYFPVIDLLFLHGSEEMVTIDTKESTNHDGTKNKSISTLVTASETSYVCVASDIPGSQARREVTVLVTLTASVTMTTSYIQTTPSSIAIIPIIVILSIVVCVAIVLSSVFLYRRRKRNYGLLTSDRDDTGSVSYLELWELIDMCDIATAHQIVNKLLNIPDRESDSKFERSKKDLYHELCKWKEESSGDLTFSNLFGAMEEIGLDAELNRIKQFRGRTDDQVSDDDLEHICWHVHKCKETVQPILRALYHHKKSKVKLDDTLIIPTHSRCDVIKNDFQLMKVWKADSVSADRGGGDGSDEKESFHFRFFKKTRTTPQNKNTVTAVSSSGNHDEDGADEETLILEDDSVEVDMKPKTTASNQRVQLSIALEVAGRKVDESDRWMYLQLAKTFFQIDDTLKKEPTDDEFKKFALSITKPHCQRLGKRLSEEDLNVRNDEDLMTMFRTDVMLKAWAMEQHYSNYEIRCRLREAAKRCNRQDITDIFIDTDQSQVMLFNETVPTCMTVSNKPQIPQASEQKYNTSDNASIQPAPENNLDFTVETEICDAQQTVDYSEADIANEMAISRDELERIGRYAGTAALLALCGKYGVTVPGQQCLEGKELHSDTKLINMLKQVLDREHDMAEKDPWADPPRIVLKRFLQHQNLPYDCLLPLPRVEDIFSVELIELAFRLIMTDVYPFAKALDITDQALTSYRPNRPKTLDQGTIKMLHTMKTAAQLQMIKDLKAAGFSQEARAIHFGFEISLADVVEVENRVDNVQLAKELGILTDDQTSLDVEVNGSECHQSVLLTWRDTVHSSSFNSRMVLADAVFAMGERQLALDIISGVYRRRAMSIPVVELLARNIPKERLGDLSKVLQVKEGQTCKEVISCWATKANNPKNLLLSNKLVEAGFYEFAYEIMVLCGKGMKRNDVRLVKCT